MFRLLPVLPAKAFNNILKLMFCEFSSKGAFFFNNKLTNNARLNSCKVNAADIASTKVSFYVFIQNYYSVYAA